MYEVASLKVLVELKSLSRGRFTASHLCSCSEQSSMKGFMVIIVECRPFLSKSHNVKIKLVSSAQVSLP